MRHLWRVGVALTAVAALGVGASTAAADPSERGEGAPGRVCKEERGLTPGTQDFRDCVRELAHQRGQRNGNGPTAARRGGQRQAARQACRAQGLQPRTAEFRQCVRTALQTARAQRQALRAQRRAARQTCLATYERGTPALRQCLREARQLGR